MKLIEIVGKVPITHNGKTLGHHTIGILDTPCSPCRYYAGVIRQYEGKWHTTDNCWTNFFRAIEEAIDQADSVFKRFTKLAAQD